jgi:cold shock CspA family protein
MLRATLQGPEEIPSRTDPGSAPCGPAPSPSRSDISQGTVEWVQRGDAFVRHSEIGGYGFRSLEVNQQVEFEVTRGPQGAGVRAV